jgi:hypothetical protein
MIFVLWRQKVNSTTKVYRHVRKRKEKRKHAFLRVASMYTAQNICNLGYQAVRIRGPWGVTALALFFACHQNSGVTGSQAGPEMDDEPHFPGKKDYESKQSNHARSLEKI